MQSHAIAAVDMIYRCHGSGPQYHAALLHELLDACTAHKAHLDSIRHAIGLSRHISKVYPVMASWAMGLSSKPRIC